MKYNYVVRLEITCQTQWHDFLLNPLVIFVNFTTAFKFCIIEFNKNFLCVSL